MTPPLVLGIGLLGGLGAIARLAMDSEVSRRASREFPYGTFAVNLVGAFVLGVLVGLALHADAYRLAGTGLIGAFTTFSTWMLEGHRLGEDGRLRIGVLNFLVSLVLGVILAWLGRHIGASL